MRGTRAHRDHCVGCVGCWSDVSGVSGVSGVSDVSYDTWDTVSTPSHLTLVSDMSDVSYDTYVGCVVSVVVCRKSVGECRTRAQPVEGMPGAKPLMQGSTLVKRQSSALIRDGRDYLWVSFASGR